MIRFTPSHRRREGVILVVVVALLALFAVVGLGYVMYAESAATAARMVRDNEVVVNEVANIEPEMLLAKGLGGVIYDYTDNQTGVWSAIRGGSLARSMYGWNYQDSDVDANHNDFVPELRSATGQWSINNPNNVPFNGMGRLRYLDSGAGYPIYSTDILNFSPSRIDAMNPNAVLRDPERYPIKSDDVNYYRKMSGISAPSPLQKYFGGINVPYTYPDNNNVYLAAVRASDGQVLIPSFHRPYLFTQNGTIGAPVDPTFLANTLHPDWYRPSGRLKLLRPRPIDQMTQAQFSQFGLTYPVPPNPTTSQVNQYATAVNTLIRQGKLMPFPSDMGGDVKNLLGSAGGNDSVWVDIGMPVRTTASGKKYKPLMAYLIVDMDGRINLNVAGNIRALDPTRANPTSPSAYRVNDLTLHASNQGIGRHEINLSSILNVEQVLYPTGTPPGSVPAGLPEWTNVFLGQPNDTTVAADIPGRYAHAYVPSSAPSLLSTLPPTLPQPYSDNGGAFDAAYGRPYSPTNPTNFSTFYTPSYFMLDVDAYDSTNRRANPNRASAIAYGPTDPLTLSSFPSYSTSSGYVSAAPGGEPINGYGNDSIAERTFHPMLFNPQRPAMNMQTLDGTEMHKLIGRYDSPLDYKDSVLANLMPKNFARSASDFPAPATQYAAALANSHRIRHMITLASADLGRPGIVASALAPTDATNTAPYKFDPAATDLTKSFPVAPNGETFKTLEALTTAPSRLQPSPVMNGTNDFQGNSFLTFAANGIPTAYRATFDGRARIAAELGRLDLNRALRPYPNPIMDGQGKYFDLPTDQTKLDLANLDRRAFAADIFTRLRAAVGSPELPATHDPAISEADYRTLSWLAQLAVNIVDYIDEDDIMTQFTWIDPTKLPATLSDGTTPTSIVYGVEMPKVVLNEAYVEVTNGDESVTVSAAPPPNPPTKYLWQLPASPPTAPNTNPKKAIKYQVNVWAELHNTMVPPTVNGASATETQSYQDFVNRHTEWLANGPAASRYSTYRLKVVKPTLPLTKPPVTPTVTNTAATPTDTVEFTTATTPSLTPVDTATTPAGTAPSSYRSLADAGTPIKNGGFYVVGPDWTTTPINPTAFKFDTPGATMKSRAMTYDIDQSSPSWINDPSITSATSAMPAPTLVLQRLANPYRTFDPNLNPYITVDVMALPRTLNTVAGGPTEKTVNPMIKYVNSASGTASDSSGNNRKSVGRRQPFVGSADQNVVKQLVSCPYAGTPPQPAHTFFSHNASTGPTQAPAAGAVPEAEPRGLKRFDWFVHLDRKLISPIELFHVSAVAPWDVTQKFVSPDPRDPAATPTMPAVKQGHTARWTDENLVVTTPPPPAGSPVPSTRLYRALEYFRVQDRTIEMPFGGREIGKVNINTIWDKEVFDAIFDAIRKVDGTGNLIYSATSGFTQKDVDEAWKAMMGMNPAVTNPPAANDPRQARTRKYYNTTGTPNTQTYDQITADDRPFWGLGAPHETAVPTGQYKNGAGIDDTILRKLTITTPLPNSPKRGLMFDAESQFTFDATNNPQPAVQHPFLDKSMLSKVFDHFTTRSNVFAVYMTVGFFEVVDDTMKPELLGNEMGVILDGNPSSPTYGQVIENKAIRHRMFAIVDRTNLALQPAQVQNGVIVSEDPLKQGPAPFYYNSAVAQGANPNQWQIRLPVNSLTPIAGPGKAIATGSYNGRTWSLAPNITTVNPAIPGTVLYLGTGTERRRLAVASVTQSDPASGLAEIFLTADGSMPGSVNLGTIPASWKAATTATDPQTGSVLITNALLGNPGPQPDFDHRDPRYQGVVIYSAVLD